MVTTSSDARLGASGDGERLDKKKWGNFWVGLTFWGACSSRRPGRFHDPKIRRSMLLGLYGRDGRHVRAAGMFLHVPPRGPAACWVLVPSMLGSCGPGPKGYCRCSGNGGTECLSLHEV
jgi:hypothetical protein